MSVIRILDENISSRIAAGEVVERPASIVKELIENSADAGATAVSVSITDGGISCIRVSDNGVGISADDMPLTIVKHATSKIYSLNDLESVYTMGFRGEALSSIAAVSMLTIKSKAKNEDVGSVLTCVGGKNINISAAGLPDGTTVLVENLFFNTPARLKFLKKPSAEAAQISGVIASMIIAHPEISFKYTSGDKLIYHSPGDGSLLNAVLSVEGNSIRPHLFELGSELYGMKLRGYIGDPSVSYKKNSGRIYINTRPIKSELISAAVIRAYGERLLKGASPFYVFNISMDARDVDVNVHPNKLNVHFKDDNAITYLVQNAVTEALDRGLSTPVLNIGTLSSCEPQNAHEKTEKQINFICSDEPKEEQKKEVTRIPYAAADDSTIDRRVMEVMEKISSDSFATLSANQYPSVYIEQDRSTEKQYEQPQLITGLPEHTVIGTVFGGYIIVEAQQTVYFIDQHAAHERIIYDKLRADMEAGVNIQPLLVSEAVRLSHAEYQIIEDNIETLLSMGFDIEPFGALTLKVSAIPVYLEGVSVSVMIHDIAEELTGSIKLERSILPEKIAKAACKRAVKGTWKLPPDAVDAIVNEIIEDGSIPNCPHGRPVAIAITKSQLEKGFKRRL